MLGESLLVPSLIPVFPLPEVVLFPRQILPLHMFERRYRKMTADALSGQRTIAVSLLKSGYEPSYFTSEAPIHALVGVGQIIASEKLAQDKYNLVLQGTYRARIVLEMSDRSYRRARIVQVRSVPCSDATQRAALLNELTQAVHRRLIGHRDLQAQCLRLFEMDLAFEEVVDLICGGLPVAGAVRQRLLSETHVVQRALLLIRQLELISEAAPRRAYEHRIRQINLN